MLREDVPLNKQDNDGKRDFRVGGKIKLEGEEGLPEDVKLTVYVFNRTGQTLGATPVDAQGAFRLSVDITEPIDVQVVVGPEGDPQTIRRSDAFSQSHTAKAWAPEGDGFQLHLELLLPRDVVALWRPTLICVSGHLRKKYQLAGTEQTCPVPFVKAEIYDVDREECWWPFLRRWWDLVLDRSVISLPELLQDRPLPKPFPWSEQEPDPSGIEPVSTFGGRGETSAIAAPTTACSTEADTTALGPSFSARLEKLTLTSRIAPWLIFPTCFYSRQLVGETTTDEFGYFRSCFRWWPFQLRRGRSRLDARPDILIKITQVSDGLESVIYLDPYTSTRWNLSSAHVDLYVGEDDVK